MVGAASGSCGVLLEIQGFAKSFAGPDGALPVLHEVNLEVAEGEFLSIIGPSGCGKTTLLRCIGGFERGSAGQIRVDGRDVAGPGLDRMMVFQNFNQLFPWLTVLGNLELALKAAGGKSSQERRRRAFQYLEMVGLAPFAQYYPHQLSGGMQQRVAIARALCVHPRMLLMDEPFAALDALTRNTLQQELLRIWRETGVTILFVTHNVQEAIVQSDRILVLRQLHPAATAISSVAALLTVELERPRSPDRPGFGALWRRVHTLIGLRVAEPSVLSPGRGEASLPSPVPNAVPVASPPSAASVRASAP